MEIVERTVGDVTVLDLKGRLILGDGEQAFRDLVTGPACAGCRKLLLNFAEVTFLDSAGVGSLVWKYVTMKKQSGDLKLMHLTRRSRDILRVTKLDTVLASFDSEAAALKSFGPAAWGSAARQRPAHGESVPDRPLVSRISNSPTSCGRGSSLMYAQYTRASRLAILAPRPDDVSTDV